MALKRIERQVSGFFSEFWRFAVKGNAVQLAFAVVIGGAFGAVVNAIVTDLVTPLISLLTGNVNFSGWEYVIREATVINGTEAEPLVIAYGHFLQVTLNFLIVGLSIFLIYKLLAGASTRFQEREAEKPTEPPVSNEEKLLTEIRDILRGQGS